MNILLIGSGGREHALAVALSRDPSTDALFTIPGNPGTAQLGTNLHLDVSDSSVIALAAKSHAVELAIIGPEAPLVDGLADAMQDAGIPVFGPSKAAAQLEGSKAFAKDVMRSAGVPTAQSRLCQTMSDIETALDDFAVDCENNPVPWVVKDDGLAAGKGVLVTRSREEALAHADYCISELGHHVIVEEYLDGPEVSLFCLSDGATVVPLEPAQDFKRVGEGQTGPNTGGMGAYSPLPWAPKDLIDTVVSRVAQPTVNEMAARGCPFVGLLYCGLALTSKGIKVVEFNVRFGDPETQVVLPRLETPLAQLLLAAARGELDSFGPLSWSSDAAVGVIVANEGYPGKVVGKGRPIAGVTRAQSTPDVDLIHCGTQAQGNTLTATGGRVLCVVGKGKSVADARMRAYEAVRYIDLEGSHYRRDIAQGV
ncbi:MAG: phosphoribosylamine--glycine ligase [Actinomycetaceae bacterium]|nr:phosphoribosylamine--glycine ligase [Actinomycetaceae bacterium]